MATTELSQVIANMHVTLVANFLASIFRLHRGYMYVKLAGIDPKALGQALQNMLQDFDVKWQVRNDGLEIVVADKKQS